MRVQVFRHSGFKVRLFGVMFRFETANAEMDPAEKARTPTHEPYAARPLHPEP